jgi:phosphate transport system substrate-binding protein
VITIRKLIAILFVSLMVTAIATSIAATDVKISGSTTVFPLGAACAETFNGIQSDYHVSVAQGGTGGGITDIAEGRTDIAMASREVTSDEKSKYGDKFQETLIGYDGLAVCVSKAIYNANVTSLTRDQVKKIYSGEIKNWKEVGGPDEPIYAISREQGSGTRDTFLEDVFGSKKAETLGVRTYSSSSSEVKVAIVGSDNAIGYLGYSYSEGGNLRAVKLDSIEISPQTIKDKTYPLARTLYLVTFGNPKAGAQAYMDFVKGPEGQKIAKENGFIPHEAPAIKQAGLQDLMAEKGKEESAEKKQPGFEFAFGLIGIVVISYMSLKRRAQ